MTDLQASSFDKQEEAIYFSLVTSPTPGYGDIVLPHSHRLLGAFETADGVIMLGWTTAIVVAVMEKVYSQPRN